MAWTLVVLVTLMTLACSSGNRPQSAGARPAQANDRLEAVGIIRREFVDETRRNWAGSGPRPLHTTILYPASAEAPLIDILEGASLPFTVPRMAVAAPMAPLQARLPLVLLSHGTGGSALQLMWLGHDLAARGYVVALVDHHGNTAAEPEPAAQGFVLIWERARDLSVLLDALLVDPTFGSRIDPARVGAAGFSLGGYTILALAGGRFSNRQLDEFCRSPLRDATCDPQSEFPDALARFAELRRTDPVVQESLRHADESFRDERVQAVFALAPALGSGLTPDSLSAIRIPVGLLVGQKDTVCPPATNAEKVARLIPHAELTVMPGDVGHYAFLAECTPAGRQRIEICRDAAGIDRADVHRRAAALVFEFFSSKM